MGDWSTTRLLLVVNGYVFLAFALLVLSGSDLLCQLRKGNRCARRHRLAKFLVAAPLALSCLALLAIGLFAVGVSHGSQPKTHQVVLFILGCLTPCLLLLSWVFGSLVVDGLWSLLACLLLFYFSFFNPALYIRYWADDNYQWAQMWMARHYETGGGGLDRLESSARTWYQKAAENGNKEAQYRVAKSQRHVTSSRKWYLLAAKQGHAGAMVQLARLTGDKEERQKWLKQAAASRHPEALFMLARDAMSTDLPAARRLMLEAAEGNSRSAIVLLIDQYQQGGILFDQDQPLADAWQAILEKTPAADTEPEFLTTASMYQTTTTGRAAGVKTGAGDPDTLYRKARDFLDHPAKDQVLHDRAIAYLRRAVESNHSEAAVLLAKLAGGQTEAGSATPETIGWLEIAAAGDNIYALGELTRYYKNKPEATVEDLGKSLDYNMRLLQVIAEDTGRQLLWQRQQWSGEYRDTEKKQAQLKRLGGSWQAAIRKAENNPDDEFLLAEEMIAGRQYNDGMQRMQSAAQRGSPAARLELARRVLQGPRNFSQEVHAISELQELDRLDFLPASFQLGMLYQSGTGVVPKNI